MRAARAASRSMAMARLAGSVSIHSTPTDPEPAPMSHSSSPLRGASAASVIARTSLLVIWPSCSNQSSRRPPARGMKRAPRSPTTSSAMVLSAATPSSAKVTARAPRTRSRGPPIASRIVSREPPMPRAVRKAASFAGVEPSQDSASMRAQGCKCGAIASSARPCRDKVAQSCWLQPIRAAASAKAEGAGRQAISSARTCRVSSAPTP